MKHPKANHACAQIRQLQIMVLMGRHLGAKLNTQPNMGPQANHKQMQHLQGKCTQQVKMQPIMQLTNNMLLKIILQHEFPAKEYPAQ